MPLLRLLPPEADVERAALLRGVAGFLAAGFEVLRPEEPVAGLARFVPERFGELVEAFLVAGLLVLRDLDLGLARAAFPADAREERFATPLVFLPELWLDLLSESPDLVSFSAIISSTCCPSPFRRRPQPRAGSGLRRRADLPPLRSREADRLPLPPLELPRSDEP